MYRHWLSRAAVPVAAAGLVLTGVLPAQASTGWRLFTTVSITDRQVVLYGVAATSPNHAWAVGSSQSLTSLSFRPVVEHWTGSAWRRNKLPSSVRDTLGTAGQLNAVGAASKSNMWAFDTRGHWLHWNGTQWTAGRLPEPTSGTGRPLIRSVKVFSGSNAWAVGSYINTTTSSPAPYAAHFNGSGWHIKFVPGAGIMSASAVSSSDIWGVIDNRYGTGASYSVVRWNGTSWQTATAPSLPSGGFLRTILARSDGNVWVGGVQPTGAGLAAHWNGTTWTVVDLPPISTMGVDDLLTLTRDGTGGMWALGVCDCGPAYRLWHESGGKWLGPYLPSISGDPQWVTDLAYVPRTTSVWGVGGRYINGTGQGMILLYGSVP